MDIIEIRKKLAIYMDALVNYIRDMPLYEEDIKAIDMDFSIELMSGSFEHHDFNADVTLKFYFKCGLKK